LRAIAFPFLWTAFSSLIGCPVFGVHYTLQQAATSYGIIVDKMLLLRQQPTEIHQHDLSHLSDEELEAQIRSKYRELVEKYGFDLDGSSPTPPAGPPPVDPDEQVTT
jgi:hypothetical protein